jgi:hypothetical protein
LTQPLPGAPTHGGVNPYGLVVWRRGV